MFAIVWDGELKIYLKAVLDPQWTNTVYQLPRMKMVVQNEYTYDYNTHS